MEAQLNPEGSRWYYQRAVTAEIHCSGAAHRISWRRGRLVLEDHDTEAEQALAALGAQPPLCVELLEAWRAWRGSELLPKLLLAKSTLAHHELAQRRSSHEAEMRSARSMAARMPGRLADQRQRAARAKLVRRQAAERIERERLAWAATLIEVLPPLLQRALALSAVADIERRWDEPGVQAEHRRHLESALATIAGPVFDLSARRWSSDLKPYRGLRTDTRLLGPGETPTCALWADRRLVHATLSLPVSWFTDVWGRGIALVDGCFVLGLAESSHDGINLPVRAARPPERDWKSLRALDRAALVTRAGDGWRLRWTS